MNPTTGDQKPQLMLVKKCSSCGQDHEVEVRAIQPVTFGSQTYTRGYDCHGDTVVVWQERNALAPSPTEDES